MASPIQELFHLVAGKNSLPQKESFKAPSIMIVIAARFRRQGGQPWAVGSSLLENKLQSGAQVPYFELTLPKAIPSFLWT